MSKKAPPKYERERRKGISRFVVPHPTYNWYLKLTFLGTAANAALLGLGLHWYRGNLVARMGAVGIDEELQPVVRSFLDEFLSMSLVMLAVLVFCVVLLTGYLFHRVAGPIYRISDHLQKVRSTGTFGELRLRHFDQLHDVAQLVNQALRSVAARHAGSTNDNRPDGGERREHGASRAAAPAVSAASSRHP